MFSFFLLKGAFREIKMNDIKTKLERLGSEIIATGDSNFIDKRSVCKIITDFMASIPWEEEGSKLCLDKCSNCKADNCDQIYVVCKNCLAKIKTNGSI